MPRVMSSGLGAEMSPATRGSVLVAAVNRYSGRVKAGIEIGLEFVEVKR